MSWTDVIARAWVAGCVIMKLPDLIEKVLTREGIEYERLETFEENNGSGNPQDRHEPIFA